MDRLTWIRGLSVAAVCIGAFVAAIGALLLFVVWVTTLCAGLGPCTLPVSTMLPEIAMMSLGGGTIAGGLLHLAAHPRAETE